MKIIKPSFEILTPIDGQEILNKIERVARTCYKSENNIKEGSAAKLVSNLVKNNHLAMIEHGGMISVKFICDRGVSHELTRHRLCSFAQESTRYCNYNKDKFGNELTFIEPFFFNKDSEMYKQWKESMINAEYHYMNLLQLGAKPEEARTVLPNSIKTEIIVTANLREWKAIFELRCDKAAHPQMRELMIPLLHEFQKQIPIIFDGI